jgi:hypothetical protein
MKTQLKGWKLGPHMHVELHPLTIGLKAGPRLPHLGLSIDRQALVGISNEANYSP